MIIFEFSLTCHSCQGPGQFWNHHEWQDPLEGPRAYQWLLLWNTAWTAVVSNQAYRQVCHLVWCIFWSKTSENSRLIFDVDLSKPETFIGINNQYAVWLWIRCWVAWMSLHNSKVSDYHLRPILHDNETIHLSTVWTGDVIDCNAPIWADELPMAFGDCR